MNFDNFKQSIIGLTNWIRNALNATNSKANTITQLVNTLNNGRSNYANGYYAGNASEMNLLQAFAPKEAGIVLYDLAGAKAYTYQNGAWALDATQKIAQLGSNIFLPSKIITTCFYMYDENNIVRVPFEAL